MKYAEQLYITQQTNSTSILGRGKETPKRLNGHARAADCHPSNKAVRHDYDSTRLTPFWRCVLIVNKMAKSWVDLFERIIKLVARSSKVYLVWYFIRLILISYKSTLKSTLYTCQKL